LFIFHSFIHTYIHLFIYSFILSAYFHSSWFIKKILYFSYIYYLFYFFICSFIYPSIHFFFLADTKPPKITQYRKSITVNGSETLEISCYIDGVPVPDVFWVKDNLTFAECTGSVLENSKHCKATVDTNADRFTVSWMGTHSLLTIHSASHMYDEGVWKCLAKSQVGKNEADLHVVVHGNDCFVFFLVFPLFFQFFLFLCLFVFSLSFLFVCLFLFLFCTKVLNKFKTAPKYKDAFL